VYLRVRAQQQRIVARAAGRDELRPTSDESIIGGKNTFENTMFEYFTKMVNFVAVTRPEHWVFSVHDNERTLQ
jgi:hypothetical protein